MYRIFDIALQCNIPLPGLPHIDQHNADISIEVLSGSDFKDSGFSSIFDFTNPEGQVVSKCLQKGGDHLLRFPALCDFLIAEAHSQIFAYPSENATENTIAHLIVDQLIPRVLGHEGAVIAHASGVVTTDNEAIVFLGNSGCGKSTLAASFFQSGLDLLTDDCLQLEHKGGQVIARSAYPSIRLWPGSAERMFTDESDFQEVAHFSDKRQLLLADSGRVAKDAVKVAAIFALGDPEKSGKTREFSIELITGTTAAMKMIEAAFVLELKGRQTIERCFLSTMKIAQSGIPFYALDYPRRYESLPEVRQKILEHLPK